MIPKFEEDLFHLECSGESFNQNSSPDSVVGNSEIRLREEEYVVPETGFQVVFHLWKVEVGTGAVFDELGGIVVKVECEIEKRGRQGSIVNRHACLVQVPTPRSAADVNRRSMQKRGTRHTEPKERRGSQQAYTAFRQTQNRSDVGQRRGG